MPAYSGFASIVEFHGAAFRLANSLPAWDAVACGTQGTDAGRRSVLHPPPEPRTAVPSLDSQQRYVELGDTQRAYCVPTTEFGVPLAAKVVAANRRHRGMRVGLVAN